MPSSSTRRILASDIRVMPWKNGGGVTREIATGASPVAGHDWGWRFSIAEVAQDGPFSIFPGIDRIIAVVDGAGMDLVAPDGTAIALEPFHTARLAGEDPFFGRLRGGPVRDLNIMTRRDHFSATLDLRQGASGAAVEVGGGTCLLVHNLAGRCALRSGGGEIHELAAAETLVHEGDGSFEILLGEDSRAAIVFITPKKAAWGRPCRPSRPVQRS